MVVCQYNFYYTVIHKWPQSRVLHRMPRRPREVNPQAMTKLSPADSAALKLRKPTARQRARFDCCCSATLWRHTKLPPTPYNTSTDHRPTPFVHVRLRRVAVELPDGYYFPGGEKNSNLSKVLNA